MHKNVATLYEEKCNRRTRYKTKALALNTNFNCSRKGNTLFPSTMPFCILHFLSSLVFYTETWKCNVKCSFLGDVKSLYERATVPAKPEVPMTPMTKRNRVDLERDKRELMEEMENREALREHRVPGYFDSELGKAFLLSQVLSFFGSKHTVNLI